MNNVPWESRGGRNLFSSKMKAGEVLKGRKTQLPYFTGEKTQAQRGHVTCSRSCDFFKVMVHSWQKKMCYSLSHIQPLWDPVDCSPLRSSVHGIPQARILEWIAITFSRGSSQPRDRTWISCIAGRFFTIWATVAETESKTHDSTSPA